RSLPARPTIALSRGPAEYDYWTSHEPTRPEAARARALSHGSVPSPSTTPTATTCELTTCIFVAQKAKRTPAAVMRSSWRGCRMVTIPSRATAVHARAMSARTRPSRPVVGDVVATRAETVTNPVTPTTHTATVAMIERSTERPRCSTPSRIEMTREKAPTGCTTMTGASARAMTFATTPA